MIILMFLAIYLDFLHGPVILELNYMTKSPPPSPSHTLKTLHPKVHQCVPPRATCGGTGRPYSGESRGWSGGEVWVGVGVDGGTQVAHTAAGVWGSR